MHVGNELQDAIEQYFKQYPIDVEATKIRYKEKNKYSYEEHIQDDACCLYGNYIDSRRKCPGT